MRKGCKLVLIGVFELCSIWIIFNVCLKSPVINKDEIYSTINNDISLMLNEDNSCISYCNTLGIKDRIYMIKIDINTMNKLDLYQSIKDNDAWINAEKMPPEEMQRYILRYTKYFEFLKEISDLCKKRDAYLYLHVYDDSIYSVEYCVAAISLSQGSLYYFKMET